MSPNDLVPQNEENQLPEGIDPELAKKIQADMADARKETSEAIDFKPPLIKIGKASFLFGEAESPVKSFKAVIFSLVKCNAYWHKEDVTGNPILIDEDTMPKDYTPGAKIPLCSSVGSVYGIRESMTASSDGQAVKVFGVCGSGKKDINKYSFDCGDCYLNHFGTAVNDAGNRTRGKACKNMRRMLLLVEGERIPHLLTLPPTSLLNFDAYCRFIEAQKQIQYVWTHFALEKDSAGEMVWYLFSKERAIDNWEELDAEIIEKVYGVRQDHKDLLGRVEITEDEYKTEDDDVLDFPTK